MSHGTRIKGSCHTQVVLDEADRLFESSLAAVVLEVLSACEAPRASLLRRAHGAGVLVCVCLCVCVFAFVFG